MTGTIPGPVPNPSDQRRRRNKTGWIDRVQTPRRPVAPGEPPRAGKGATASAWREYARSLGHTVPASAARGEIIAMVDEGFSLDHGWHELARDWYRSLADSAQSVYYEPSDWQTARVLAELLSRALRSNKVTASLIERWQSGATELLTTEGARRRMRMEIERPPATGEEADADVVSELDEYRRRLHGDATG